MKFLVWWCTTERDDNYVKNSWWLLLSLLWSLPWQTLSPLKIAVIALDIEYDYFDYNNVHNNPTIKLLELVE